MAEKNRNGKFQDFVQKDGVIKEQVNLERKLKGKEQWNYYDMNKICLEIALEQGLSEEEYKQMIRRCTGSKLPSPGHWKLTTRQECPKTTAGEVGWRHEPENHNLELYGALYKSPKLTMMPLFEPVEVIFLG